MSRQYDDALTDEFLNFAINQMAVLFLNTYTVLIVGSLLASMCPLVTSSTAVSIRRRFFISTSNP